MNVEIERLLLSETTALFVFSTTYYYYIYTNSSSKLRSCNLDESSSDISLERVKFDREARLYVRGNSELLSNFLIVCILLF